MYWIWVILMGLAVGFVAFPIAQRFGYAYGRFGRTRDMVLVVVGAMIGGVLISLLGSAIGLAVAGDGGGLIGGFVGALIAVVLLVALATKSATDEPGEREDIA